MSKKIECEICGENCLSPDQLFMLPNVVWSIFCLDKGLDIRDRVCADCYEKHLGRKIDVSDLTLVPLNLMFIKHRYPDLFDRFKKGVEMSANTELLLFIESLHTH